jgi:hypothetical protein
VYHLSALTYLSCIGDIDDSPDFRRTQEEFPFSFLMNVKGGVLYFFYVEERSLALREKRTEIPAY